MTYTPCQGPLENATQKRVLVINDLSCFGKCSLTVSLPVLAACGVEAVPLPTAILSTHTGGFPSPYISSMTDAMQGIFAHWRAIGLRFDAIYSGYLCGEEQIALVEHIFDEFSDEHTLLVVDPVMGDGGKLYSGFDAAYAARMKHLCARAHIITPNLTEAALLTGHDAHDITDASGQYALLHDLLALGAHAVVLTGATRPDGTVGYLYTDRERTEPLEIRHDYIDKMLHGCGDAFASALCGALMQGRVTEDAVRLATDYTLACIRATLTDAPTHWYGLKFEAGLPLLTSCPTHQ